MKHSAWLFSTALTTTLIAATLLAPTTAPQASGSTARVVGVDQLNVRTNANGTVVDRLLRGDEVSLQACDGNWCEIQYFSDDRGLQQGVVSRQFLKRLPVGKRAGTSAAGLSITDECDLDCIISSTASQAEVER